MAQMEPIGDVVFGDAVRDVEHVDVAALGADVDRSGPIRKEHVTQWPDIRFAQRVRAGSAAA